MRNYHRIQHYMREVTADGSFTGKLPRGTLGLLIRIAAVLGDYKYCSRF
jgi:hypothetical protein